MKRCVLLALSLCLLSSSLFAETKETLKVYQIEVSKSDYKEGHPLWPGRKAPDGGWMCFWWNELSKEAITFIKKSKSIEMSEPVELRKFIKSWTNLDDSMSDKAARDLRSNAKKGLVSEIVTPYKKSDTNTIRIIILDIKGSIQ
ncbi:MAG: hypothetical protein LBB89_06375 [Treponema sp.]|jgi:hypothetical protein|nr:hypothetical protein [Treponema sp.]